jgi:hypothetical protein
MSDILYRRQQNNGNGNRNGNNGIGNSQKSEQGRINSQQNNGQGLRNENGIINQVLSDEALARKGQILAQNSLGANAILLERERIERERVERERPERLERERLDREQAGPAVTEDNPAPQSMQVNKGISAPNSWDTDIREQVSRPASTSLAQSAPSGVERVPQFADSTSTKRMTAKTGNKADGAPREKGSSSGGGLTSIAGTDDSTESQGEKLAPGTIAGIVCAILFLILIGAVVYAIRRRKKAQALAWTLSRSSSKALEHLNESSSSKEITNPTTEAKRPGSPEFHYLPSINESFLTLDELRLSF